MILTNLSLPYTEVRTKLDCFKAAFLFAKFVVPPSFITVKKMLVIILIKE